MHIATKCCWESHHVAPFSRNSCTYCIPLQRNLGITGLHVATIVCTPVHRCAWPPLAVAKFVLQSTFSCDLHLQDRQISAVVVTCTINNPSIFCAVKLAHYNLVTVQVVGRWCHIGLAVLKNVRWCSWCCAQEAFHFLFLQLQVRFENSVKAAEKKKPCWSRSRPLVVTKGNGLRKLNIAVSLRGPSAPSGRRQPTPPVFHGDSIRAVSCLLCHKEDIKKEAAGENGKRIQEEDEGETWPEARHL